MSSHGANAYLKWFVRDWRSSRKVQRMDYIARGLYRELLDEEHLEGSLPNDIAALADICSCPIKAMEKAWPQIKPCFQEIDGRLFNSKLESMRTDQDRIRVKRAEAGRMGGIAKHLSANAKQMLDAAKQGHSGSEQMPYSRAEQRKAEQPGTAPDLNPTEGSLAEDLEPSMVAAAVMDDLHLSGMKLRIVLDEVCSREMRAGKSADELRSALVDAWRRYESSKPRLSYIVGGEKFFAECWHSPAGWPWKDGEAPATRPVPINTAADSVVAAERSNRVKAFRLEAIQ